MRRTTLGTRIALLCVAVAALTAVLAGLLAAGLIHRSGEAEARRTLARVAAAARATDDERAARPAAQRRLQAALRVLGVQLAEVGTDGTVTGSPLAQAAVTPADLARLDAGLPVSAVRHVDGRTVYVEGRPTASGGVVVAQRRADATVADERALRRTLVALLVATGVAGAVGLAVAGRLARPLRRTADATLALAAGARDVSVAPEGPAEVAGVAEAVNRLAAALATSEGRQREFLLSVSHELRTPLTAISGYAESLAGGVVPADQTQAVAGVVLDEARRLDRLVSDLLDLARLDAQDFRITPAAVDVTALAHDTAAVWAGRCAAAGVPFRLEAPPAPLPLTTDAARLRQVLDGLLENALRVTPAGAPIVLAARGVAGGAELEVRDGGPGLTDDDLAVAFERAELFRRYQGVRRVGTGLGLAIVHRLVARLGGSVEAGHAAEGGARFTVTLPAG